MNNSIIVEVGELLDEVRSQNPLVHHITNYVTVNDCANITLAIGASPIMADDIGEAASITSISSSFVINIGTLNTRTIESMIASGKKANELNIPVIFDPVGAGVSELRNQTVAAILDQVTISVLRGNISEIGYINGSETTIKGVDASESDRQAGSQNGIAIAKNIANQLNCVVVITGETDIVTDGNRVFTINNGHSMLANVTGTGCMSASLIGAFCGATTTADYLPAAIGGTLSMGLAGEISYEKVGHTGSGSFHIGIIDAISKLDAMTMMDRADVSEA
ncbi:hydroxyethylthiazole kinase [Brevibacillus daliensis]|uniref:hydroxyethylthiazole kinase n=1 Tax=Brevibacillus daliensis TaxID=2892995 RepID=UPI001E5B7468|nr:hydroxyethylthiazole kinase [Brevibacillus daliensis]